MFHLKVVERRGEMIVRVLEPRCIGSRQSYESAQRFLVKADSKHTVQMVEIVKRPGQTLGKMKELIDKLIDKL